MNPDSREMHMSMRDYECDLQGVVNNAVYLHYLEHARHQLLKHNGVDFAALAREGTNLVVVRAEVDYRAALTSGDSFTVSTWLEQQSRLKFLFHQHITRNGDDKPIVAAVITGTAVNARGRPFMPPQLQQLLMQISN